jgi:hypothetical protein
MTLTVIQQVSLSLCVVVVAMLAIYSYKANMKDGFNLRCYDKFVSYCKQHNPIRFMDLCTQPVVSFCDYLFSVSSTLEEEECINHLQSECTQLSSGRHLFGQICNRSAEYMCKTINKKRSEI